MATNITMETAAKKARDFLFYNGFHILKLKSVIHNESKKTWEVMFVSGIGHTELKTVTLDDKTGEVIAFK